MRRLIGGLALVLAAALVGGVGAAPERALIIEASDSITMGGFTYKDTTIEIEQQFFNPQIGVEYRFGNAPFGVGGLYASSANTFDGEWEGDEDSGEGSFDVERTEAVLFFRWVPSHVFNMRLGYRMFNYEFSDGEIEQFEDGMLVERDSNAEASGDLTGGLDLEMTLAGGDTVRFAMTAGLTYFLNADYDWSYDKEVFDGSDVSGHREGSDSLSAYSVRLKPELSFKTIDALRIFVNGTVAVSTWDAEISETEDDYVALDLYTAVGVGARYTFGFGQ